MRRDALAKLLIIVFVLLTCWWLILIRIGFEEISAYQNLLWAASYQILAILGGIFGLWISFSWGSASSVMGRAILSFSAGLLFQAFGQSVFSYYNLFSGIDIPYPSAADVGFFGSIPFYVYGIILLAKVSGVAFSIKSSFNKKIQILIFPLLMLILSYVLFLRNYEFDWENPIRVFLDFGYPLGQAIYVSIAVITYYFSKKFLGGIMRPKILFILFALIVQYSADYNFLFQAINGSWKNGGYGDVIYMTAYLLMALGLLQLKSKYISIRD